VFLQVAPEFAGALLSPALVGFQEYALEFPPLGPFEDESGRYAARFRGHSDAEAGDHMASTAGHCIEAREGRPDPDACTGDGVFLVHREFAGGPRGSSLLRSADPFDLVVIDEAHEVFANIYKRFDRNGDCDPEATDAQMAGRVRSLLKPAGTPVLLLTATPIQNSLTELWGLVQYVEPTGLLFGKLPTFREVFCEDRDRSLVPDQTFELRRLLGSVLQRTLRRQAQEFLAFLLPVNHAEGREFKPWGTDLVPQVVVGFEAGGVAWRIAKTFSGARDRAARAVRGRRKRAPGGARSGR
jgi:hypothetical protein